MGKTVTLITPVVVGFIGVGNDQVGLPCHLDPVGQLIVERIAVIEKTTGLYQKASRIGAGSAGHPTDGTYSRYTFDRFYGALDVFVLDTWVDKVIVDPAIAMTD